MATNERLFHMTVWGRNDSAPNGYSKVSSHTVTAINGFEAAKRLAKWRYWTDEAWQSSPENGGRPELIIRNETPE